jgi:hypothetical protein
MKKEIDYLEIENYLLGELDNEQLLAFKKRLDNDTDFAKEVALYTEINTTLSSRFSSYNEENKLRNTLEDLGTIHISKPISNQINNELKKKEPKVFSLKKYSKYMVAASLILFASLLWINMNTNPTYSDFVTYETIELTVRGDNNEHLLKAQKTFNNKDFSKAQKELEILLQEDSTKVELQLYLAISLIEQNKFDLADSILIKIIKGNTVYKNKAIWNLALSKLKQKDYTSCKEILQSLPPEADDYVKANKLLDKL